MKKYLLTFICMIFTFSLTFTNVFAASRDMKTLTASKKSVVLENTGYSEFIDALAKYSDGTFNNVNLDATWESDNQDVAVAYEGRILATGKGNAKISVLYNGFKQEINVTVLDNKDLRKEAQSKKAANSKLTNALVTNAIATALPTQTIIDKADQMTYFSWTPTKNLTGWKGGKTFLAGTNYIGIPYTQTKIQNQVDNVGFRNALNASDFYTPYNDGRVMPMYGNDCSGFVSFCWGLSRKVTGDFINGISNGTYLKVGTYNTSSPSSSDLMNAYKLLQTGNAVVMSDHTFLIDYNDTANSKCYCYEQHPYGAQYTVWTYASMAAGGYMPFGLK